MKEVQNLIGTDQRNVTFSPPTFSNFYQILKLTCLPAFKTPSLKGLEKKLASSSHACLVHATQSRTCFKRSAYCSYNKARFNQTFRCFENCQIFKIYLLIMVLQLSYFNT